MLKVESEAEIESQCPTNFNLRSECFAAVAFNTVDDGARSMVCAFQTRRSDAHARTTRCAVTMGWPELM